MQESQPSKTAHESGRQLPDASIGSLFDSGTGKRSIFKKLFGKKSTSKPRSMTVCVTSKLRAASVLHDLKSDYTFRVACLSTSVVKRNIPSSIPP